MTPLEKLIEGNRRFVNNQSIHPNRAEERRLETANTQEPFATIVGCSDSRVSPEILFDTGLGDLFVVRVAGNVVGPIELASIEFSVHFLHSSLILVKGHENCGAVTALLDENPEVIPVIAPLIKPAVTLAKRQPGNPLENAIKNNVLNVVAQLKNTPSLKPLIAQNRLTIAGSYYHFKTGEIDLL